MSYTDYLYVKRWFTGRINRKQYLTGLAVLVVSVFLLFTLIIFTSLALPDAKMMFIPVSLFVLVYLYIFALACSLHARRFHDFGWSGRWVFVAFFTFGLFLIVLLFVKGQQGENKYGLPSVENIHILELLFNTHK